MEKSNDLMKVNIPFYKQPDTNGCVVATLRMALEYFGKKYTWKQLNKMVERKVGRWASMSPALVKLKKMGWDVKIISTWDYAKFAIDQVKYMYKIYGKEITEKVYLPNYDFEGSKKYAKDLKALGIFKRKKLSFKEIEKYFKKGYIVATVINSRRIRDRKGYMGHLVVITGINKNYIWFHESSFEYPESNKKVNKKLFIKAHEDKGTDFEVIIFKK